MNFYFLGSSPTFSLSLDPLLHQKYLDQFLNECGGIIAEHVAEHGVEAGPTGVEELGELARILELVQGQLAGFVRGRQFRNKTGKLVVRIGDNRLEC